jgi:hypothetical protein
MFRVDFGCYGRHCVVVGYLQPVGLFSKFQLMRAIVVLLSFVLAYFPLLMYHVGSASMCWRYDDVHLVCFDIFLLNIPLVSGFLGIPNRLLLWLQ